MKRPMKFVGKTEEQLHQLSEQIKFDTTWSKFTNSKPLSTSKSKLISTIGYFI